MDGPYANIKNVDGYVEECERASTLGMVGKWALHPSQIEHSVKVFSPTQAEVDLAREVVAVYRQAEKDGVGAVEHKGMMLDAASARFFQLTVDRADLIGM